MEAKKLNLLFASTFALIFLIGFASAVSLSPTSFTLSKQGGSFLIDASSTSLNDTVALSIGQIKDSSNRVITFTFSTNNFILNNNSQSVNVSYSVPSSFNFEFLKEYQTTLTADASNSTDATASLSFENSNNFCEYSNIGDLNTDIRDVTLVTGFGEDTDWFPFDKVEVEVLVENNGDEDIDNIALEWGIYDTQSDKWLIEPTEEDNFDLNNGKEKTVTFDFTIDDNMDEDLQDLESGDYVLYVRASGEITSGTNDGDKTCSSDSKDGTITIERNFVILNNIQFPETVQCDSDVQITADAWNIGSKDQNSVYVVVYNKELGINQKVDVGDIDSFDSSDFSFNFQLPEGTAEKKYPISLTVYDDNNDVYETGDNQKSTSTVSLDVQGNCVAAKVSVTAILESGGQAGKPLVIKATVTNTGDKTSTYLLNAASYTEWASSVSLDKTSLTLDAGKSEDVLLTFNVNKNVLGTNLFNFEVLSGNKLIASQPVQVDITKNGLGSITGNLFSGDNKYIWGIGILNLILIVLIIVIAVRITRKK